MSERRAAWRQRKLNKRSSPALQLSIAKRYVALLSRNSARSHIPSIDRLLLFDHRARSEISEVFTLSAIIVTVKPNVAGAHR
jgi:hypothetical protein